MIDYGTILAYFYRDYLWQCRDVYDFGSILWQDGRIPAPTKQELDSKWEEYETYSLNKVRKEKIKSLLSDSDWSEMPSSQSVLSNYNEWMDYRIKLKRMLILNDYSVQLPETPEKKWKN